MADQADEQKRGVPGSGARRARRASERRPFLSPTAAAAAVLVAAGVLGCGRRPETGGAASEAGVPPAADDAASAAAGAERPPHGPTRRPEALPAIEKTLTLGVFTADMLGNQVANGGLEVDADGDGRPDGWGTDGKKKQWVESKGDGTGGRALKLTSTGARDYTHCGPPAIPVRAGQKYLYTAWVWSQGMKGGSNLWETYKDGKTRNITCYGVFAVSDSTYWQFKTKVYTAPENIKTVGLVPVIAQARPGGYTLYDNLRFTLYGGSDFAAECHRAGEKPRIDGRLGDGEWVTDCPIPFIGTGQLEKLLPRYEWSRENLSAVGYLMWDAENLYLAMKVRDDKLTTSDAWSGDPSAGDGFRMAFDPSFRGVRAETASFELQIAPSKGARHVIYRPKAHSAGLAAGHLYRDSSVFEFAVKPPARRTRRAGSGGRDGTVNRLASFGESGVGIVYELRLPFAALGELAGGTVGGKFGFSVLLGDNDGEGRAASIRWGGGLSGGKAGPRFDPKEFGVVTFVE